MPAAAEIGERLSRTSAESNRPGQVKGKEIFSAKEHTRRLNEADSLQKTREALSNISSKEPKIPTEISESLRRCGVNVDYVDPTPLGEGEGYQVFKYNLPNEPKRLVKFVKPRTIASM